MEVYWRGAWLCTAHPHNALSRAEQQRILAERRAYAGELRRRQRRARRQARGRLAPATADEPAPTEVTRLTEDALSARRRAAPREDALRAAAGGPGQLAPRRGAGGGGVARGRERSTTLIGARVVGASGWRGERRHVSDSIDGLLRCWAT